MKKAVICTGTEQPDTVPNKKKEVCYENSR